MRAVREGIDTVVAWGGDGTVNEVATTLAFTPSRLGIVPTGSGNGLARGLGIPLNAVRALDVAIGNQSRTIDVGEVDGRLFVNVAGIGLDATIAHAFAVGGLKRRGFRRYAEIALRESFAFRASDLTIVADGETIRTRPLLLVMANGSQFGGGAVIAPGAQLDDGKLDLIVAVERSPLLALAQAPWLFLGRATSLPGVSRRVVSDITITSSREIKYHLDGEPCVGGTIVRATIRARALRVMAPQPTNR
jgi:YegS/Rv2252/BmrU family lipid kinase